MLEINYDLKYNIFGDVMKTVKCNSSNELTIKNSRFITLLFNVENVLDVDRIFENVKKEYPKATHYCYAYIINNYRKSSDDGEPGGTAGIPMLNVLEKENIINVLAVTIRYFGGIKLGAGGLVRAYSKTVKQAIDDAIMIEVVEGYLVKVNVSYEEQKNVDYILKKYTVVNKSYLQDVTYEVLLPKANINIISDYNYEIIEEKYIEKVL